MDKLKAPKNLLDLLEPEICDIPDAQIELSLEHPFLRDNSIISYFFRFKSKVHVYSDEPARLGHLPQYVRIVSDGDSFPSCREKLISQCLELGYVLAERDAIVISVTARIDGRRYEVMNASPEGVSLRSGPYQGWNLLSEEKISKIKEICQK